MQIKQGQARSGGLLKKIIIKTGPFLAVLIVAGLVILPLGWKISSEKSRIARQKAAQKAEPKPLTNVVVMQVEPCLVMEKLSFPGIAKPWISLEVVSETRGKVVAKKIREGCHVKKGDVLAIIDKRDYQNALDSARASYETALATEKRLKALVKKKFVTQSQLDGAVGRVKIARSTLENAKLNLERCTIVSPMDGIVDRVDIENGKFLNPGDPVALILELDKLKIQVGIPESDVGSARRQKFFDMIFDALDGKAFTGVYYYLSRTAAPDARLYNLEIQVENPEMQILPDMFARVVIVKNQDPDGLAVPTYSIVNFNAERGVYVEKNGTAKFTPVVTGFQTGWKTQVKKGLVPGDRVVVSGQGLIEDGQKIHVVKIIHSNAMGEPVQ